MRNPFRRRNVAELTSQYTILNQKRAAKYRAGKLSPRAEARYAKKLSRILNTRHKRLGGK